MNTATHIAPGVGATAIPIRELLPWVIFAGLICLLGIYFVGAEEGATSIIKGMYVHEFVHDSRHLLGYPTERSAVSHPGGLLSPFGFRPESWQSFAARL
jgi:hypothetical protein